MQEYKSKQLSSISVYISWNFIMYPCWHRLSQNQCPFLNLVGRRRILKRCSMLAYAYPWRSRNKCGNCLFYHRVRSNSISLTFHYFHTYDAHFGWILKIFPACGVWRMVEANFKGLWRTIFQHCNICLCLHEFQVTISLATVGAGVGSCLSPRRVSDFFLTVTALV